MGKEKLDTVGWRDGGMEAGGVEETSQLGSDLKFPNRIVSMKSVLSRARNGKQEVTNIFEEL